MQDESELFNKEKLIREREGEQDVDAASPGVCLDQLVTHREQVEKTETSAEKKSLKRPKSHSQEANKEVGTNVDVWRTVG